MSAAAADASGQRADALVLHDRIERARAEAEASLDELEGLRAEVRSAKIKMRLQTFFRSGQAPPERRIFAPPLQIRTIAGDKFTIDCSSTDTVLDLKYLIAETCGVQPDEQGLVFEGEPMQNPIRLSSYRLLPGSQVFLLFYPRGKMFAASIDRHEIIALAPNLLPRAIRDLKRKEAKLFSFLALLRSELDECAEELLAAQMRSEVKCECPATLLAAGGFAILCACFYCRWHANPYRYATLRVIAGFPPREEEGMPGLFDTSDTPELEDAVDE